MESPIRTSPEIDALAAAFVAAQAAFVVVPKSETAEVKSRTGQGYTYNYATMAGAVAATQAPLAENGLGMLQPPTASKSEYIARPGGEGYDIVTTITITTRLQHKSGQWMESDLTISIGGGSPQDLGSAITYGRRYAWCAMLGLAVAEDNDAAGVEPAPRSKGNTRRQQRDDKPKPAEVDERREMQRLWFALLKSHANAIGLDLTDKELTDDRHEVQRLWLGASNLGDVDLNTIRNHLDWMRNASANEFAVVARKVVADVRGST